jgi:hypothetical protein
MVRENEFVSRDKNAAHPSFPEIVSPDFRDPHLRHVPDKPRSK